MTAPAPGPGRAEVRGPDKPLRGLAILVAEDSLLQAEAICDILQDAGARIVGPFPTVQAALESAAVEPIDCAILDVQLLDGPCFPICAQFEMRGTPFLFLTGYHRPRMVPLRLHAAGVLAKPIDPHLLTEAILARCRRP